MRPTSDTYDGTNRGKMEARKDRGWVWRLRVFAQGVGSGRALVGDRGVAGWGKVGGGEASHRAPELTEHRCWQLRVREGDRDSIGRPQCQRLGEPDPEETRAGRRGSPSLRERELGVQQASIAACPHLICLWMCCMSLSIRRHQYAAGSTGQRENAWGSARLGFGVDGKPGGRKRDGGIGMGGMREGVRVGGGRGRGLAKDKEKAE
ncbi:hypothetical protein C8Q77DRAFT_603820 [Trametes polyzona]|nr:hypothetical protein C8Q77DRAFT_603820 [Trametes polyzona]